jgi:hypothetical protein
LYHKGLYCAVFGSFCFTVSCMASSSVEFGCSGQYFDQSRCMMYLRLSVAYRSVV